MSTLMTVATVNVESGEYKIPVCEAKEVHALAWVLKLKPKYDIEDYEVPHPVYSVSFSDDGMRHTVMGLSYGTALFLMEKLADVWTNPTMRKTEW